MAGVRRSFRWSSEKWSGDRKKTTMTIAIPRSSAGFGFTVAWTKPPQVDYVYEGGMAFKAGLMSGDKIVSIDKVPVAKKSKEEIENIVKNIKDMMELEIARIEELTTRKRQTSLRRKESLTKKGSKMVIQDSNIMLWRRERALLKLLLCEEDLLNVLTIGKDRFILPLRKKCPLATTAELNLLFGNIEKVGTVHEKHVQQFRQLTQGTEDNVGRMYQKQTDERFSVLRKYVYGLPLGKILLKYKFMNTPFKEFIEIPPSFDDNIGLQQFLEKPLKYISDMTSSISFLLSCTAVGHKDYVCLENVVSTFQSFEKEMNEMMNKLPSCEDLDNIDTAFDGDEPYKNLEKLQEKTLFTKGPRDFSLIHPGRYWLFTGQLSKVEGQHYIQYWGLLLSDCLILARRTEQRVLLVLEEPVMLRSIYQATFDVKNCDTEFRILFSLENPRKTIGQRNQWITWILRAPCPSLKLLWQVMITNQLSLYSTEALSHGNKARSFVHMKPQLGIKSLLPKSHCQYEESSFVTPSGKHSSAAARNLHSTDIFRNTVTGNPSKSYAMVKEIFLRKEKERSHNSLNDGTPEECVLAARRASVTRSKSFGNDIKDAIPFIDCGDVNSSGIESDRDCIPNPYKVEDLVNKRCSRKHLVENENDSEDSDAFQDVTDFASGLQMTCCTPKNMDKFVQTDSELSMVYGLRKSPKKKFPRLGTFERIKLENKSTEKSSLEVPQVCLTRTGTSVKHRRPISTTMSKEQLIRPETVSPLADQTSNGMTTLRKPSNSPGSKKRVKEFFTRFWKKESKNTSEIKKKTNNVETQAEAESSNLYSDVYVSSPKHGEDGEQLNFELIESSSASHVSSVSNL